MNVAFFTRCSQFMKRFLRMVMLLLFGVLMCMTLTAQNEKKANSAPLRLDGHRAPVDSEIPSYEPAPPMTGDLHIVGGAGPPGNMPQLIDLWVDIFKRAHPSVRVYTAVYSAAMAASAIHDETAEVGPSGRELMPYEIGLFRNQDYKPVEILVGGGTYATDGATCAQLVFVNKTNPLQKLTLPQLDAIFSKSRKRGYKEDITRWGQLGLTGEWADKPIHVYGYGQPNGMAVAFSFTALKGGDFKDITIRHRTFSGAGSTTSGSVNLVDTVAEDPYGIAYAGLDSAQAATATKIISIGENDSGPFFDPSFENVLSRKYPLGRLIYLDVIRYPGKPINPLAKEFIRVALSREGQEAQARTLYMPLPAAMVIESLRKLE